MKRYLVLVGEGYYPAGWDDFVGSFDDIDAARFKIIGCNGDWYEIVDCEREEVCDSGGVDDLKRLFSKDV